MKAFPSLFGSETSTQTVPLINLTCYSSYRHYDVNVSWFNSLTHVLGTVSGRRTSSFMGRALARFLRLILLRGTRALPLFSTPLWPQACGWLFPTPRRPTALMHFQSKSLSPLGLDSLNMSASFILLCYMKTVELRIWWVSEKPCYNICGRDVWLDWFPDGIAITMWLCAL